MDFKFALLAVVLSLSSASLVYADDYDLRNLLDAQFWNLTQDIRVGAKVLKIKPEEIETVGVSCLI